MPMSAREQQAIANLVRAYLDAVVAADYNGAAAAAITAQRRELFAVVFPLAGGSEKSIFMVDEFAKTMIAALSLISGVAAKQGISIEAHEWIEGIYYQRRQIGI